MEVPSVRLLPVGSRHGGRKRPLPGTLAELIAAAQALVPGATRLYDADGDELDSEGFKCVRSGDALWAARADEEWREPPVAIDDVEPRAPRAAGGMASLLETLGDVLPVLLPERSSVLASMRDELHTIVDAQFEARQGVRAGSDGAASSVHPPLRARAAADASASESRLKVYDELVRLIEAEESAGGARLLALARSVGAHVERWGGAVESLERDFGELRVRLESELGRLGKTSSARGDEMKVELSRIHRFVIEQTKSYLGASAERVRATAAIEEEANRLRAELGALTARVRASEERLEGAATASQHAELSSRLDHLASEMAAKAEVRAEIQAVAELVQRPAVVVSKLAGPHETVVCDAQLQPPTPQAHLSSYNGTFTAAHGGGGGGGGGGGSRPSSAQPRLRIVPGASFRVVGKDGALYKGTEPPVLAGAHGGCGDGNGDGAAEVAGSDNFDRAAFHATPISARSRAALSARPRSAARTNGAVCASGGGRSARSARGVGASAAGMLTVPMGRGTLSGGPPLSDETRRLLGAGYRACRARLLSLERELMSSKEVVCFKFGPAANASGDMRVSRPEHAGGREMWLQWTSSRAGSGWAFYEAAVRTAPAEVAAAANHRLATSPSEIISTQRWSLGDFLAQLEARYVGYVDLLSVVHAGELVWRRDVDRPPHQPHGSSPPRPALQGWEAAPNAAALDVNHSIPLMQAAAERAPAPEPAPPSSVAAPPGL